jgi:hypothetical protein
LPVTASRRLVTFLGHNRGVENETSLSVPAAAAPSGPRREPIILLALAFVLLAWSGLKPHDRFTWLLEVAPILIATHRRFP